MQPLASLLAGTILALSGAVLCLPGTLHGQQDTTTAVAGARYRTGPVQQFVLGRGYRELWTRPVRVEVLDPATFGGGLTVLRRGGGRSTHSLHLQAADGRRYAFRQLDKDMLLALGPEFQGTLVTAIVQDQVSAKYPAAGLVVPPLLEAAGVLHVSPRLFVMPDHAFLGEHRAQFAGRLGTMEERPDDGAEEGAPGFAGAVRVAGTDRLLEHLESSSRHRVDSRAYLRARLVDLLIGDWDRHEDQWRWARFDRADGVHLWQPIPRDRDNAFVSYEGLLLDLARRQLPRMVEFRHAYPDIYGLTIHAARLDRRLLTELPREVWDSVATDLRARITDAVIDAGILRLPAEYRELSGAVLAAKLRARRDHLPEAARRFYALLATDVDVHGTAQPELAEVERLPDGSVEVRLSRRRDGGATTADPFFRRTFRPEETRELRIYLGGGDNHAIVRGEASRSIGVRVIGGDNDDVLVDSSRVRGGSGGTAFYDGQGENRFVAGSRTRIDRSRYVAAADTALLSGARAYRDWGSLRYAFTIWGEWRSNVGPLVGGGPEWTRFGFRRDPYAYRMALRGLVSPLTGRVGVEYAADIRRINSETRLELRAQASDLEVTRFHGYGNQTPREGNDDRYKVLERSVSFEPAVHASVGDGVSVFGGPLIRYTTPRLRPNAPAAEPDVRGSQPFGQLGGQVGLRLDFRDSAVLPRRGVKFDARVAGYPVVWNDMEPFVNASATASAHLPLPFPGEPALAFRTGGLRTWGDFPFQEAAFLGGSGTLRGYPDQRYSGDMALFGGVELRTTLGPAKLLVPGQLGALALVDVGRVYADGRSPGGWHAAYGGGLWFRVLGREQTFSVTYAYGEEHRIYLSPGFAF
jgi:hypothetical protein